MAKTYYIALGEKANGFFDQTTGIAIGRGQKVEITERQRNSKRISLALNSGALKLVQPDTEIDSYSENELEKMNQKLKNQISKGVTEEKLLESYTLEQAKALAAYHDIEVEENDTVETIIDAIIEDLESNK